MNNHALKKVLHSKAESKLCSKYVPKLHKFAVMVWFTGETNHFDKAQAVHLGISATKKSGKKSWKKKTSYETKKSKIHTALNSNSLEG